MLQCKECRRPTPVICPPDCPPSSAIIRHHSSLPILLGQSCQNPGECVVQLFWATPDFSQNYYYCVDVVMAAAAPSTTTQVVQPTVVAQPTTTQVVQPTVVAQPTAVNVPAASVSFPATKMVTSVAEAGATALAAANGTTFTGTNANAGRRRARILWF